MKVVRYRSQRGGCHTAVVASPGRKWLHMVTLESYPVSVYRVPLDEEAHMTELPGWTVRNACRAMLRVGKRYGITKGASELLKEGLQ